jgi:hypothetical protein
LRRHQVGHASSPARERLPRGCRSSDRMRT